MDELRRSGFSAALLRLYAIGRLRRRVLAVAGHLEGGQFRSGTMRDILSRFHQVEIGAHSYGPCFTPGSFPAGAVIGRYVSMAGGVARRLNHPLKHLVLHPYFYNEHLGHVGARTIQHQPITIGHDAWIGQAAIFTENCTDVGIGAVIGAGSVVTRNVGAFEIVAGNPARVLRRRFDDTLCDRIIASAWWERPVEELANFAADLNLPVEAWPAQHPLLRPDGPSNPGLSTASTPAPSR